MKKCDRLEFLPVLEDKKSEIKVLVDLVSTENLLMFIEGLTAIFPLCPYLVEGVKELSGSLS